MIFCELEKLLLPKKSKKPIAKKLCNLTPIATKTTPMPKLTLKRSTKPTIPSEMSKRKNSMICLEVLETLQEIHFLDHEIATLELHRVLIFQIFSLSLGEEVQELQVNMILETYLEVLRPPLVSLANIVNHQKKSLLT